jgi:hypothetical protein
MRLRAAALAGALLLGAAVLPARAHTGADRRKGATQFDLEVRITKPQQPGNDPHVVADSFGNLYAVARKVTPASPDDRLATKARLSAWRWTSADGGATWTALSGVPGETDARLPGSVSDVAVDGAGHAYVLDGPLLYRYAATGLGDVAFSGVSVVPVASPTALAANGDGVVLVLAGTALYVSRDGGQTFGTSGYAFAGATDCRLAAGPKKSVYASCLDGAGHVLVFASHDDGRTFTRSVVASYDPSGPLVDVPPVAVAPDGTVYALRPETAKVTTLFLMRSADGGRTWTQRRLTDEHLLMTHLSLTAAPDGRLGAAMYVSEAPGERWFVAAGMFAPLTGPLLVVSFADHTPVAQRGVAPPEGAPGATFLPDSRLALDWTVVSQTLPTDKTVPFTQDVWFVRSQRPDATSDHPDLARTPRYDIPPCTVHGQVRKVADWQQIKAPAFRERDGGAAQGLVAYAVDPFDPRAVYASNGTSLMRSDDGGCRWREVWSLEPAPSQAMPLSAATARVVAIAVPEDRREHATVYAVLTEGDRARVVRSPSGEPGTFVLADSGLPPAGAPGLFRVSGANPDFLYLTAGNALYASEDAGATWTSRTPVTEVGTATPIDALALDPKGPNNLYAVVSGALRHSRDGGRTWDAPVPAAAVQSAAGTLTAVDVFHADAALPRVAAWSAPAGSKPATVLRSADDGATWTRETARGIEGTVESAVHGSGPDVLVVSTLPLNDGNAEVYARDPATRAYVDVSPVETTEPFRVSADRRGHPTFYGMGAGALFRYAGDAIEPPSPPEEIDDSAFTAIDPPVAPPVVTPPHAEVRLPVGSRTTLPFTIDVAPRRPRLDVMLLADTSESMTGDLPALRRDLLRALARLSRDVDVWAGVAQAKTDAAPPIYRRERDVGPISPALGAALDRLDPTDGAGLETQLIGLDQLVTGAGMDTCPSASAGGTFTRRCLDAPIGSLCEVQPDSAGCDVRPGQQANFRDGALHVVLHATDTTFRNPEGTPRDPEGNIDIPGVAEKYEEAGVLQVGLAVDPEGVPDLARMALLTGAVAPAGGLDCTGDGVADVRAGRPAVCGNAAHVDGVLRALVRARTPLTHIHAEPPEDAPASVALEEVTPEEFEDVDRTVAQHLAIEVAVSCAGRAPGHYDVALHAEVHDESETEFGVGVECVPPTVAVPRPPRPLGGIPPVLPPIPPGPPAPPQPPNVNVNPNVQAQAQPQSQVQGQVGVAAQQREQVEAVLAEADRPGEIPAPVTTLAGMLGVSMATALALQRRAQAAAQSVRARF